ncbi:MAG: hypothetical protein methR_P0580 [Methyloprofundus sp.]|nr:MAG: hypothetical protein methR_P0580 [Methyloprofundus sp.]
MTDVINKEVDFSQRVFIRPKEIQKIYGISISTVYRLMAIGEFPKLISLSPRCKGWHKSDLEEHFRKVAAVA